MTGHQLKPELRTNDVFVAALLQAIPMGSGKRSSTLPDRARIMSANSRLYRRVVGIVKTVLHFLPIMHEVTQFSSPCAAAAFGALLAGKQHVIVVDTHPPHFL